MPEDRENVIATVQLVPLSQVATDQRFLDRWAELERRALEPNPFFAPAMVLPAARHLEDGDEAGLLVVGTADRLDFLLPVQRVESAGGSRWGIRTWRHDYCFLGTPLMSAQEHPDAVWSALLDALRGPLRTPLLTMPLLTAGGPALDALQRVAAGRRLKVAHSNVEQRAFARRRPEPTYLAEWTGPKKRADLARRRRVLGRDLGAEIVTADRGVLDPDLAIEQFLRLEAGGWKGRNGTALSSRPRHAQFFREMAREFVDQGRLMFLGLQAEDQVLALNTALVAGPGLFGFKKAYDESHARCSPGTLLDLDVLARFHRASELAWLDTCSAPTARPDGGLFGDRLTTCTAALAVTLVGRGATTVLPQARRVGGYLRDAAARRLVPAPRAADPHRPPLAPSAGRR